MSVRRTVLVALGPILLALLLSPSALARPAAATHHRQTYCPAMFGAHRGEGWPTPNSEDGSKAIAAALADPTVEFVESDVWATKDGKGLMQHSDDLSQASNATGQVSDHTLAWEQQHVRMDDGSVPESLPQYVRQVVAAKKHAIVHDKSPSINAYVARVLKSIRAARKYVRVMSASWSTLSYMQQHLGWYLELARNVTGPATKAQVARVLAFAPHRPNYLHVLIVDTSRKPTPASWIQPYIAAGVATDYVSYSAAQDKIITRFAFTRVMSGDPARAQQISGCTA